jgi:hypothetical protein
MNADHWQLWTLHKRHVVKAVVVVAQIVQCTAGSGSKVSQAEHVRRGHIGRLEASQRSHELFKRRLVSLSDERRFEVVGVGA